MAPIKGPVRKILRMGEPLRGKGEPGTGRLTLQGKGERVRWAFGEGSMSISNGVPTGAGTKRTIRARKGDHFALKRDRLRAQKEQEWGGLTRKNTPSALQLAAKGGEPGHERWKGLWGKDFVLRTIGKEWRGHRFLPSGRCKHKAKKCEVSESNRRVFVGVRKEKGEPSRKEVNGQREIN